MKQAKIICAFPLCGKSYVTKNLNYESSDSDSSKFSWIINEDGTKVRNPKFPQNYIEHIKSLIPEKDFIFVSTHKDVLHALNNSGIPFTLVRPSNSMSSLMEWKRRYENREFNGFPLKVMIDNWSKWHNDMTSESKDHKVIVLNNNQYISDILDQL